MRIRLILTILPFLLLLSHCAMAQTGIAYPVQHEGAWVYVDSLGNMAVPVRFDTAGWFHEGRAVVGVDGRLGFINREGQMIIAARYDSVLYPFQGGYAMVKEGRTYILIDREGQAIFRRSESMLYDGSGVARCWIGRRRWELLHCSSGAVFEAKGMDEIRHFSEGLAVAVRGKKEGYVDAYGEWVLPPKFLSARPFQEGKAAVHTSDGAFYIQRDGSRALPGTFAEAYEFQDGYGLVRPFAAGHIEWDSMPPMRLIDSLGQYVEGIRYWMIGRPDGGLSIGCDNGNCVVFSIPSGKVIASAMSPDRLLLVPEGILVHLAEAGSLALLSREGKLLWTEGGVLGIAMGWYGSPARVSRDCGSHELRFGTRPCQWQYVQVGGLIPNE